ncbi:MAG: hypothetical protein U1F09_02095 [Steroidobacteraceae bacterium]
MAVQVLRRQEANTAPLVYASPEEDIKTQIASEIFTWVNRLPVPLRERVRDRFSRVLQAIDEEESVSSIKIESLRAAFRLLIDAKPAVAPSVSVRHDGNLYLQWFDGRDSILGVTVKSKDAAIWSASQTDPADRSKRMNEAGQRPIDALTNLLRAVSPWVFRESTGEFRRPVAA